MLTQQIGDSKFNLMLIYKQITYRDDECFSIFRVVTYIQLFEKI